MALAALETVQITRRSQRFSLPSPEAKAAKPMRKQATERTDAAMTTPRKLLDVSKATALGWTYKTELEDGIRLAYEDFLNNPMRAER